ncbi:SDR family oxidoreductase [Teichococcus aerophilus]|uniref:SDR family oxidoreductase n=1 Tax=Teichococcus aerophilus TaxID=1224513 RepID=UPI0019D52BFC|nr:SDR family oxidoreductase [Pseudoroseomonas aerophila]
MTTNVYAMFWLTKAAMPHLPPGSAIIVASPVNADRWGQNIIDYACTKAANEAFVQAFAEQAIDKGIRANGVAPELFWTPLQVAGGQTREGLKTSGSTTPLGRPGQPVELASVYVELAAARRAT